MSQTPHSALSELRELGLTIDIPEKTANRIWADLVILDGLFKQVEFGIYTPIRRGRQYLRKIYHAIAGPLVDKETADIILEEIIPAMAGYSNEGGQ